MGPAGGIGGVGATAEQKVSGYYYIWELQLPDRRESVTDAPRDSAKIQ